MSAEQRVLIERLNKALAVPNPDEIRLPDGRILIVRDWQSSIKTGELASITATFYIKDSEGFVGVSGSME